MSAYNIFSDCFVTIAFAQYGLVSGDQYFLDRIVDQFKRILGQEDNPKERYNKTITRNKPLKNFALPMILSNLAMELKAVLTPVQVDETITYCIDGITGHFLSPKSGLIDENVMPDGEKFDSFEGRLISPGQGIEVCWFLMDIASNIGDKALMKKMGPVSLNLLE